MFGNYCRISAEKNQIRALNLNISKALQTPVVKVYTPKAPFLCYF